MFKTNIMIFLITFFLISLIMNVLPNNERAKYLDYKIEIPELLALYANGLFMLQILYDKGETPNVCSEVVFLGKRYVTWSIINTFNMFPTSGPFDLTNMAIKLN